jgi:CDP-glucose 4,6-dehydratase
MLAIATGRAGNVIGGGDWAEDRLVPDVIRALIRKKSFEIRNPNAVRPWQHVLEPLEGYLNLSEKLYEQGSGFAEAWNFGPNSNDHWSVKCVVETIIKLWGRDVNWQMQMSDSFPEANQLHLDSVKARTRLDWQPRWILEKAIQATVSWHQAMSKHVDMRLFTVSQIEDFSSSKPANNLGPT